VKSVIQVAEQARLYPGGVQPPGTHQSYPVPLRGATDLKLAFLYCKAMIVRPREGLCLWPPAYVAMMSAATGRFDELKAVTARDFGQGHVMDQPLGNYITPADRLTDAFLTKQARLYQAYDQILPAYSQGKGRGDVKQAADEFRALFAEITERPLFPYYQYIAKDFLSWLGA
jgi:hypothetical protein